MREWATATKFKFLRNHSYDEAVYERNNRNDNTVRVHFAFDGWIHIFIKDYFLCSVVSDEEIDNLIGAIFSYQR